MRSNPNYRTPISVLRRFTGGDIELRIRDTTLACDPPRLSEAVSDWIARRFNGDRTAAEVTAARMLMRTLGAAGYRGWSIEERSAFRALALLFAQIPGLARWPVSDRHSLIALMRAKATDDFRFQRMVARHRRLRAALVALTARESP